MVSPILPSPSKVWQLLPPPLHRALLLGADGADRLLEMPRLILPTLRGSDHQQTLALILADMILCAWESTFLDPQAAQALCRVNDQARFLPPAAADFAAVCANARPAEPEDKKRVQTLLAAREPGAVLAFLDARRQKEPGNVFWLRYARYMGIHLGELDWYEPWTEGSGLPAAFDAVLRADYAFAREDWRAAAELYAAAHADIPLTGFLTRRGEAEKRSGQREQAQRTWREAVLARPWQTNLILRLTDCLRDLDRPGAHPAGQGHVLLYSWNHGPDLTLTMEALAASELGDARIVALDNGSTDETPALLAAWEERLAGRLTRITLPVNIGAPAARNWLLHREEVRRGEWAVFLDDDALVPEDWLGFFGTALRAHPDAGIIGCRVVERDAPLTMQSVDLHFEAPPEKEGLSLRPKGVHPGNVVVNTQINEADLGQYAYLRPCISVTGCCHLLTRRSMDEMNGFDLRFSPSQFDDFERDLRSSLAGSPPLYQGHLAVRHIKRNNMVTGISPWQQANVAGNMVKLWKAYTAEQVETIIRQDLRAASLDMRKRLRLLDEDGKAPAV